MKEGWVGKKRFLDKGPERFRAAALEGRNGKTSLPPEIAEGNRRSSRETRLAELRRKILTGSYCVTAQEISSAIIDKHLKR